MKNFKLLMVGLLVLVVTSCLRDDHAKPIDQFGFSNGNAAALIAGSLAVNSNGVVVASSDVVFTSQSLAGQNLACGTVRADTINRQNPTGASYTYNYHSTYNFVVNCNSSNQPDNTSSSLVYSGSYSNTNYSSMNSGSSTFTTTGLAPSSTQIVLNGDFKQAGSFQSTTTTTVTGNHNIDIMLQNLTFTKATKSIASGTANISVTGSTPNQGSFSYTGTLLFNGNNTATLTLNQVVYKIDLITGVVTKM